MRRIRGWVFVGALLFSCAIHAAGTPAGEFGKTSRYDDDFRALCSAKPRDIHAAIKCIPLTPYFHLSLGGDLRLREEAGDPTRLAGGKPVRDSYLLERALVDGDLRFGDDARVFVQLGYHNTQHRAGAAKTTDNDRTDLQQGFVDFGGNIASGRLTERLGRQEINFGAGRLVSARDTSNVRRSFDATNTIWTGDDWNVRGLFGHPVLPRPGAFDDIADHSQSLWGVYASSKQHDLDVYYLGFRNRNAKFAGVPGEERRQSLGVRTGTKARGWDGEIEAVGQFGTFAGSDIRAFGVYTQGGYTWKDVSWHPRLGLRADALSGDRHPGNGAVGTFNPLFGTGTYFTQAGYNAAANLYDLYPSLQVSPTAKLSFELGYDELWRYSTRDAFYQPPLTALFAGNASTDRHIGAQTQLSGNWRPNSYSQFNMALVHFTPGAFALAAGGRPANFTMGFVYLRF